MGLSSVRPQGLLSSQLLSLHPDQWPSPVHVVLSKLPPIHLDQSSSVHSTFQPLAPCHSLWLLEVDLPMWPDLSLPPFSPLLPAASQPPLIHLDQSPSPVHFLLFQPPPIRFDIGGRSRWMSAERAWTGKKTRGRPSRGTRRKDAESL